MRLSTSLSRCPKESTLGGSSDLLHLLPCVFFVVSLLGGFKSETKSNFAFVQVPRFRHICILVLKMGFGPPAWYLYLTLGCGWFQRETKKENTHVRVPSGRPNCSTHLPNSLAQTGGLGRANVANEQTRPEVSNHRAKQTF